MQKKINLRPVIQGISDKQTVSTSEDFQNSILRPILKLQNDVLIQLFLHYTYAKNSKFDALKPEQKLNWTISLFAKDNTFKHQFIGMITGMLELDELLVYLDNKSEFNKRILQMGKQRIQDNLKF